MNKETFIKRLDEVGKNVLDFSKNYVYNNLSKNILFTIKPNSFEITDYLNENEKENLKKRVKEINKTFKSDEVAERLVMNEKVPVWIDCSVIKTTKKETIVELLTSRRFGIDNKLYHQNESFPPFHINIVLPPYYLLDNNKKFDANWRFNKIKTYYKIWKNKFK